MTVGTFSDGILAVVAAVLAIMIKEFNPFLSKRFPIDE